MSRKAPKKDTHSGVLFIDLILFQHFEIYLADLGTGQSVNVLNLPGHGPFGQVLHTELVDLLCQGGLIVVGIILVSHHKHL